MHLLSCLLLLCTLLAAYVNLEVKVFYAKVASVTNRNPRMNIRILLGDFIAVSSCNWVGCLLFALARELNASNGNSLLLQDFANLQKLKPSVSCTSDPTRIAGQSTWPGRSAFVVSTSWGILQNYRICRSVEFRGTDHRTVVATPGSTT